MLTRLRARRLDESGEPGLAERMARVWDIVMEILDRIAVIYQKTPCNPKRLAEIFGIAVSLVDLGSVPQSLDAVQIGAANRIRYSSPKTVFILGANEGVFPSYEGFGGVLTDIERNRLIEIGLPLTNTADRAAVERFSPGVCAPSGTAGVNYVAQNAEGEPMAESVLVSSIKKYFRTARFWTSPAKWTPSQRDAFEQAALAWRRQGQSSRAREIFKSREITGQGFRRLPRGIKKPPRFRIKKRRRSFWAGYPAPLPS